MEPMEMLAAKATQGVVTVGMVYECGITHQTLRTYVGRGILIPVMRGIYRLYGSTPNWRQDLAAAQLRVGPASVISHRSAAALWSLDRFRPGAVELTSPHPNAWRSGRAQTPFKIIHHVSQDLDPHACTVLDGLPATTPARTLLDVGAHVNPVRLGSMIDDAARRKLTTYDELWDLEAALGRRGRQGTATLRKALQSRPAHSAVAGSAHESDVLGLIREARLPEPQLQYPVDCGGIIYRIDLAWPDLLLAVECEGFEFHHLPADLNHDAVRANALMLHGWAIHRITRTMFLADPASVVADLNRVIAARKRQLNAA